MSNTARAPGLNPGSIPSWSSGLRHDLSQALLRSGVTEPQASGAGDRLGRAQPTRLVDRSKEGVVVVRVLGGIMDDSWIAGLSKEGGGVIY